MGLTGFMGFMGCKGCKEFRDCKGNDQSRSMISYSYKDIKDCPL